MPCCCHVDPWISEGGNQQATDDKETAIRTIHCPAMLNKAESADKDRSVCSPMTAMLHAPVDLVRG
jgi:hypothetical protein